MSDRLTRFVSFRPVLTAWVAVGALYLFAQSVTGRLGWADAFFLVVLSVILWLTSEATVAKARVREEGLTIVEEEVVLLPPVPGDV